VGVGLDDVCDRSIGEAFGLDMATAADGPEERSLGNASGLHQPGLLRLALGEAGKRPPQFCELREVVDIARRRPAGLAAEAAHALGQVGRKPQPRLLAIAEAGFKPRCRNCAASRQSIAIISNSSPVVAQEAGVQPATLQDIPVILLTIVDEKNRGFSLGASEYLVKPVDRDKLTGLLRNIVGRRDPRVLLVDDDDIGRKAVRAALQQDG
jgi:hypothetical protein